MIPKVFIISELNLVSVRYVITGRVPSLRGVHRGVKYVLTIEDFSEQVVINFPSTNKSDFHLFNKLFNIFQ